jgi:hypothetical protein
MPHVRLPVHLGQQQVLQQARTFYAERIRVWRAGAIISTDPLGEPQYSEVVLFDGEAKFIPASGEVKRFGLGQVEEVNPKLLIPGRWPIAQGDFFRYKGVLYQVTFQPYYFTGYTLCNVKRYEQGTSA